jgi:hypothetical protein
LKQRVTPATTPALPHTKNLKSSKNINASEKMGEKEKRQEICSVIPQGSLERQYEWVSIVL